LPSPSQIPWYNVAIEAANGAIKTRMLHVAAVIGHSHCRTCGDLEAPRLLANPELRNLLDSDSPLSPGSSPAASLGASQRAVVTRRATRRVLTEFGFLLSRRVAN
jgi:hypothetical protein